MTQPMTMPPQPGRAPGLPKRNLCVPDDVVAEIISHTDTDTFFRAQRVSRAWHASSGSFKQLSSRLRAHGHFGDEGKDVASLRRTLLVCHRTLHNLRHNSGIAHHTPRKSPHYFGQVFMGDKMFQLVDVEAERSRLQWPTDLEDPLVGFLEPLKAARDPASDLEVSLEKIRTPFALQRPPFDTLFMPVPLMLARGPEHLVCIGKDMRLQASMHFFDPKTLLVFQRDASIPLRRFAMHSTIKRVNITPDGRFVAVSLADGAWVHAPEMADDCAFRVHAPAVACAELSMDGARLALISHQPSGGSTFDFWDVRSRTHLRSRHSELTFADAALGNLVSFDARGNILAAVSDCGSLCLFHASRPTLDACRYSTPGRSWRITALEFAPFDDLLALGDSLGGATVVALEAWRQVAALPAWHLRAGWIRRIGFNAEGSILYAENSKGECAYKDFSKASCGWSLRCVARWAWPAQATWRDLWPQAVTASTMLLAAGWMYLQMVGHPQPDATGGSVQADG